MSQVYCTPTDLIAYANRARLLSQLASADYGRVPLAEEVLEYFLQGIAPDDSLSSLELLKSRVEQAISNSASEINGYLALCNGVTLPLETLTTMNMDMALPRLFENLADDSTVKANADRHVSLFNKLMTGKIAYNKDEPDTATAVAGGAATVGADTIFNEETLSGY